MHKKSGGSYSAGRVIGTQERRQLKNCSVFTLPVMIFQGIFIFVEGIGGQAFGGKKCHLHNNCSRLSEDILKLVCASFFSDVGHHQRAHPRLVFGYGESDFRICFQKKWTQMALKADNDKNWKKYTLWPSRTQQK